LFTTLAAVLVLLAQLNAPGNDTPVTPMPAPDDGIVCLKTHDQISEMNRICYYLCQGEATSVTVPSSELCPQEISR